MVVGVTLPGAWVRRIVGLSAESPDDAPSAALSAAVHNPRMELVDWFDRLVILAFIFDMVVKPFG